MRIQLLYQLLFLWLLLAVFQQHSTITSEVQGAHSGKQQRICSMPTHCPHTVSFSCFLIDSLESIHYIITYFYIIKSLESIISANLWCNFLNHFYSSFQDQTCKVQLKVYNWACSNYIGGKRILSSVLGPFNRWEIYASTNFYY